MRINLILTDENICASGDDNCDPNAQCISTRGSFVCICNQGYSGDGITCRGRYELFI